jgi:hypothetical protein
MHQDRRWSRRSKPLAVGVALLLVSATFVAYISVTTPVEASTNSLISQTTVPALAAATNTSAFPTGNTEAVVVSTQSDIVIAQAAAFASRKNVPLVITASSTDASDAVAKLTALDVTNVTLIGKATTFPAAYKTTLATTVTITQSIAQDDDFTRSTEIAGATTFPRLVVVDSTKPTELSAGVNYAALDGDALIVTDGTQTGTTAAQTFFTTFTGKPITLLASTKSLGSSIAEDQVQYVDYPTADDMIQTVQDLAMRVIDSGNTANDVFAAPSDQLSSIALTGLLAHVKRGVSLIAGTAAAIGSTSSVSKYLTLWADETPAVHLVGMALTAADAATVSAPTTTPRSPAPAFRITGATVDATTWALSYTAVAGAAKYAVYDLYGTLLGESTTSTLTLPNPLTAVAVAALGSTSNELMRIDFRSNSYVDATERDSAVIGSAGSGSNYIQFLSTLKTPRVITRTVTDPFSMEGTSVTTTIAITCNSFFVDAGLDSTKQYDYDVQTVTTSANRACDAAASQTPGAGTPIMVGNLGLPPTVFPSLAAARVGVDSTTMRTAQSTLAASPTLSDAKLMASMQSPSVKSAVFAASVATANKSMATEALPDYLVRYIGFIPEAQLPIPGYPTWDPLRPLLVVKGDGRPEYTYDPSSAAYRFREDLYFNFSSGNVNPVTSFGTSVAYKCGLSDCVVLRTATANQNEIQVTSQYANSVQGQALVTVHATIPVVFGAPAIDSQLLIKLSPGHSSITGSHDRMPVHEIYDGPQYSEFFPLPAYHSKGHYVPCLFTVGLPGCTVNVNVHP